MELSWDEAEQLENDITGAIKAAKPPKSNIMNGEHEAIKHTSILWPSGLCSGLPG